MTVHAPAAEPTATECPHGQGAHYLGDCGDTAAIIAGLVDERLVARHAVRCAVAATLGLVGIDTSNIDYRPVDDAIDSFFDEAAR